MSVAQRITAAVAALFRSGAPALEEAYRAGAQRGLAAGQRQMLWPAADVGRIRGDWSTLLTTPIQNTRADWQRLVARSELAVRTDAIARRVVQVLRTCTVGSGLRPFPAVFDKDGGQIETVNAKLRSDWERYNECGIRSGNLSMTMLEAQGFEFEGLVTTGNSLVNTVPARKGSWLPYAFQFLRPQRLDFTRDNYTGNVYEPLPEVPIIHGIERDQLLDPVRFWLRGVAKPVPADWMSLAYWQTETEQMLGIPWMAPVLPNIWDNQQFRADKMVQARLLSRMGVWTKKKDRADYLSNMTSDSSIDENEFAAFERGMMISSEEKPEAVKLPDDLAQAYGALVKMMILEVGIGMGFSYQRLTTDLEGMNFASSRANTINDSKYFRFLQKLAVNLLCQPKYKRFVEWEIMSGKVPGVSYTDYLADPYRFTKAIWLSEGDDWVDPKKDAEAILLLRDMGVHTFRDICALKGKTPEEQIEQLKKEQAELKEAGLERFLPSGIGAPPKISVDGTGKTTPADVPEGDGSDA